MFYTTGTISVEVSAIKVIADNQTKIHPIDLKSIEYDEKYQKHGTKQKVKVIINNLNHHNIVPNASDFDCDDEDKVIYVLSNIVTDGAYKSALNNNNEPLCDELIEENLDLSPLYLGWDWDECHQIEAVRRAVNKETPDLSVFIQSIKHGFEVLMTPKWTKMMINLIKDNNNHQAKKWLKLSTSRFWRYYCRSLKRIHFNLFGAYQVFQYIVKQGGKVKSKSESWRAEWGSLQFVLFLDLSIDTNEQFDELSAKAQKARNTYPYYKTNYLLKCKSLTRKKIKALESVKEIFDAFTKKQFDPCFNIRHELTKLNINRILPYFCDDISDLICFEHKGWDLTEKNMFSNFSERQDEIMDASQTLTQEEYDEIYGKEISPATDHSSDSDYIQSEESKKESDFDDMDTETESLDTFQAAEYVGPPERRRENNYSWTCDDEAIYVNGCEAAHGNDDENMLWLQCTGCDGWLCCECVQAQYDFDLNEDSLQFIKDMHFNCFNCMQSITDPVDIIKTYLDKWYDSYYGEDGPQSPDILENSFDSGWKGLSIDVLTEKCEEYEFDEDDVTKYMINCPPFINDGLIEFLHLYGDLWGKCKDTSWSLLFGLSDIQVRQIFCKLKRDMIVYILTLVKGIKGRDEYLSNAQMKKLRNKVFMGITEKINTSDTYNDIRFLWNLSISRMDTESIVESINSHLQYIYDVKRNKMETDTLLNMLQSKLLLPTKENQKDAVVSAVIDEYQESFDDHNYHHITERAKRQRAYGQKQISISETVDKFNLGKDDTFSLSFDD